MRWKIIVSVVALCLLSGCVSQADNVGGHVVKAGKQVKGAAGQLDGAPIKQGDGLAPQVGRASKIPSGAAMDAVDQHEATLAAKLAEGGGVLLEGGCYILDAAAVSEAILPSDPHFYDRVRAQREVYYARKDDYVDWLYQRVPAEDAEWYDSELAEIAELIFTAQEEAYDYNDGYAELLNQTHIDTANQACDSI